MPENNKIDFSTVVIPREIRDLLPAPEHVGSTA